MDKETERALIGSVLVFCAAFLFFSMIEFSGPALVGSDGFYHIRYAEELRDNGISRDFPWWQASIFVDHFADEYLLYHLLLVPFTLFPLVFGAKLSAIFFFALFSAVFYWVLSAKKAAHPWMWTLCLATGGHFLFRLTQTRPIAWSLVLLLVYYYCLDKRVLAGILVVPILFVWSYPPFYFILLVLGAYLLARLILHTGIDFPVVGYTFVGLLAGFIINPYFPHSLYVTFVHNGMMLYNAVTTSISGFGIELGKPDFFEAITDLGFALFLFCCAAVYAVYSKISSKKQIFSKANNQTQGVLTAGIIALVFVILSFIIIRAIDYAIPFCIFFSALACTEYFKRHPAHLHKATIGLVIIVCLVGFSATQYAIKKVRDKEDPYRFMECARFADAHTAPGSVIFHTSWDMFPELFFFNKDNYYLAGLAPDFVYARDPELHNAWVNIAKGNAFNPVYAIAHYFNASAVILDKRAQKLEDQLKMQDPPLVSFSDSQCRVYLLK